MNPSRTPREHKGSLVRLIRLQGGYSPLVVKNGTRPSTSRHANCFRTLRSEIINRLPSFPGLFEKSNGLGMRLTSVLKRRSSSAKRGKYRLEKMLLNLDRGQK